MGKPEAKSQSCKLHVCFFQLYLILSNSTGRHHSFGGGGPVCGSVDERTSLWKPEVNFRYCSSGANVSRWSGTQEFSKASCLHCTIRITTPTPDLAFPVGAGDSDSGPYACTPSSLLTEPCPQPPHVLLFTRSQDWPRCSSALSILMGNLVAF